MCKTAAASHRKGQHAAEPRTTRLPPLGRRTVRRVVCHTPPVPSNPNGAEGDNMAMSVLFRIDDNGNIEVVDDGPAPDVVVDTDGQLHAETGIVTYAGEDSNGELWRWLS